MNHNECRFEFNRKLSSSLLCDYNASFNLHHQFSSSVVLNFFLWVYNGSDSLAPFQFVLFTLLCDHDSARLMKKYIVLPWPFTYFLISQFHFFFRSLKISFPLFISEPFIFIWKRRFHFHSPQIGTAFFCFNKIVAKFLECTFVVTCVCCRTRLNLWSLWKHSNICWKFYWSLAVKFVRLSKHAHCLPHCTKRWLVTSKQLVSSSENYFRPWHEVWTFIS